MLLPFAAQLAMLPREIDELRFSHVLPVEAPVIENADGELDVFRAHLVHARVLMDQARARAPNQPLLSQVEAALRAGRPVAVGAMLDPPGGLLLTRAARTCPCAPRSLQPPPWCRTACRRLRRQQPWHRTDASGSVTDLER